ncbi:hypothetical protein Pmani_028982 [Petrolisthes manimaculis]|uniref:Uncharacterized protein n=1 Tax=Petrolisthes manimaculis TaxID=1843537 RepID=A0AAE1NXV5_9EUCA|nr:hypothetical protein Pmani_029294 [Petrolisthes manimaculis]KAK4298694.1 hypothetical protein Pmani_028982 [Petrolisthes manimaculis]
MRGLDARHTPSLEHCAVYTGRTALRPGGWRAGTGRAGQGAGHRATGPRPRPPRTPIGRHPTLTSNTRVVAAGHIIMKPMVYISWPSFF